MDWPTVELERVVRIRNGTVDPSRYPEEGFELYSIPGFDAGRPEYLSGREIGSNKTLVRPGDVLFSKLNPRIPRVWVVPENRGHRQISSTEFWPLVCDSRSVHRDYLRHFLATPTVRDRMIPVTEAATKSRSRLKPDQLLSERIPLPPLSEQRRIVEIIDQADRLRRLRAEADAKAERILPALFIKMFGDPATSPMRWPIAPLHQFLRSVERRNPEDNPSEEFIYVDIASVDGTTGRIASTRRMLGADAPGRARQVLRSHDVIVSTVRPYLRATALVPPYLHGQICSTGFCVLRAAGGVGYGYLYGLTRTSWFTEQLNSRARGASYPAVTDQDVWQLDTCIPGDHELMRRFDTVVERLSREADQRREAAERVQDLFQRVLADGFSARLTAQWRTSHLQELLQEMEDQVKVPGTMESVEA